MISAIASVRRLAVAAGAVGFVAFLASACGTVSKAECQTGDWTSIGQRDGREGAPETLFDSHAESCRRHGLPADRDGWLSGRREGLRAYCTPLSGYANGSAGREYHNVCTGPGAGDFIDAYGLGLDVQRAREEAREAERDADAVELRIREVEADIERLRFGDDVPNEERERRRDELRRLESLRLDLLEERFAARREARAARADADAVESQARARFMSRFGLSPS